MRSGSFPTMGTAFPRVPPPREGVLLGANLGRAIVTNGDYGVRVRQCRYPALFPNYFGQTCLETSRHVSDNFNIFHNYIFFSVNVYYTYALLNFVQHD